MSIVLKWKNADVDFCFLKEKQTCLPLPLKDECSLKFLLVFSNIFIPEDKSVFSGSAHHSILPSFHFFWVSSLLTCCPYSTNPSFVSRKKANIYYQCLVVYDSGNISVHKDQSNQLIY